MEQEPIGMNCGDEAELQHARSQAELGNEGQPRSGSRPALRMATTIALVVYWLILFTATHIPKIPREFEPGFSDKWQHYLAYSILGVLVAVVWSFRRRLTWRAGLGLLAVISAYGAFDEITQPMFGRAAELLDWRSDVIGAATGLGIFALASVIRARRRARQGACDPS